MNSTELLPFGGRAQDVTAHLGESERYRLLADERRRRVLDALAAAEGPVGLDDLAATVSRETDGSDDRVTISLYHSHLPILEDAGVVDYDPATETAELSRDP